MKKKIEDLKKRLWSRMRNYTDDKRLLKRYMNDLNLIEKEVGKELANHSPTIKTVYNKKEIKKLDKNFSRYLKKRQGNTQKGCGKITEINEHGREHKCGEDDWLCPKCSGEENKIQFIKSDMISLMKVAKELKKGAEAEEKKT